MAGIDPLSVRPASQESAMAGASQMITTGTDRVYKRGQISEEVDLVSDKRAPFMTKLIELFNITPEVVPNVHKRSERKPNEEHKIFYERIKRVTQNKVSESVKDNGKEKNEQKRRQAVLKAEKEKISTPEKIKAIDPNIVRDYVILYAKKSLGIPKEEQDMVTANLSFVESKLKEEGFADEDFAYIYSKAQHFLIDELSLLIKDVFLKKLDTPIEVANWILHGKKTNDLSGFAFLSNKIDKYIENPGQGDMVESVESSMGKQINLNNYGINDLVDILGEMRIDLESWVKKWNKDDIHLNLVEGLEIEIIKKKELELSSLLDQHRMLEAANLLEESYIKSILRTYSIRRLERVLSKLGISPSELEENRTVAKRIVWVKKIAELKDSHLKRIFSSSWQDFKIFSKQIESLTKLIRKLGQGIPSEGLKWIESELETLAIQSATYKLNLLRTIQEFEYDAGRKRDIEHLSKVLLHMWNKKMARSNEYKRKRSFLKTIQLRLKVIARRFTRA